VADSFHHLRILAVASTLKRCQLFSGMADEDLEQIAAVAIPKDLEKGEYLFHEGHRSEGFYVVQRGAVNVHRVSPAGKEQVIAVFHPGQSFAEASLASDEGYPANARAIEATTILLVPKADFLALIKRRPEVALRMLGSMSQHLRVLVGLLDDLTLKDVEGRLLNWLLKRCPKPLQAAPVTLVLDRTKRVLASEIGTVSETLSRTLAKLRDDNLITVDGKTVVILEPRELDRLLKQHLGEL
jgi:CRP/FNR family transcriptional regulator, dissimilatory nitrate respiration regulator